MKSRETRPACDTSTHRPASNTATPAARGAAGLITTGNDPYPVRPCGDDGLVLGDDRRDRDGGGEGALPADVNKTSSAKSVDPAEDVSLLRRVGARGFEPPTS